MPNDKERFLAKVDKSGDCWLWTASLKSKGYGQFYYNGKNIHAHRAAYGLFKGPIPEGLTIDHLCRVIRCVNPGHLEAVTNKENVLRGNGPTAINARKTHCKRGHSLSGDNVYIQSFTGQRNCKTCKRYNQRGRRRMNPLPRRK